MTQVRLAADVDDALREHADGASLSATANDVLRSALGLPDARGRPIPIPGRSSRPSSPDTAATSTLDDEDDPTRPDRRPARPSSPGTTRDDLATNGRATARAARGTIARRRLPRL